MVNRLLGRRTRRLSDSQLARQGAVNTIGYHELSGQLRSALDRFAGVKFVSFWMIAVLVGLYAAAIGPLDYWIVHRLLRKPIATWITFPLWGLLFAAIGVAATWQMKGDAARLRQVELLDFDLTRIANRVLCTRHTFWRSGPMQRAYSFRRG